MKVLIVIPCFNEESSINNLLSDLANLNLTDFEITPLPVNDCSTDSTKEVLKKANKPFLDLPVNLGIGGAVQSGYIYAYRNNYDIAVQMDGDGQHPADQLVKLLSEFENDKVDVVIGSRFIEKIGFQSSGLRRMGINYFKWLNKLILGIKITDSTSGFRALNRNALAIVSEHYPDTYPEPEALVIYHLNGLKIKEVPVIMKNRESGKSSISSFNNLYYMFKVTMGILFTFIRIKFYGKRHTN